ncbi:fluoroquinolone transporter permease [Kibdelosporangium philippinense]|uniref:Fluoroquinolone transporter permease n=1 Tax=Kibdelosporangium philippinense TaxID=211113 RepID=A0ABS8ZH63_9PSEU|nr:fluoroquinolone transporter permease [Kibdelosporangium philippinense]MCE7006684.1 fluoroquinolone transporter permease [Kibdelosporangium philippinense]
MTRFSIALRMEFLLQRRYRLLHAGILSGALWLAMLLPMPSGVRSMVEPYVLLGDLTIVGFFFIAGAVFFEKDERTLHALVSTPLRFTEYLASKVVSLTTLSVVLAVLVAIGTHGVDFHIVPLVIGAVLGTVIMLLAGFLSALPFHSVSDWFMPAVLPIAVCNLPALSYAGLWDTPLLYLIPTQGPLLLFGVAFDKKTISFWQASYAVIYPILCAALLWLLARRMFDKYMVRGN